MATVEMKFVFIFALLVYAKCTSGQKNVCATPGNPITINVHGTPCKSNLQDQNKPSAHIEPIWKNAVTYRANQVIKDWSISDPRSHLAGGMKYHDGKLTLPTPGRYYIYAQVYYYNNGRTDLHVNNAITLMLQPPTSGKDHGVLFTAGMFYLKAGDVIALVAYNSARINMYKYHTHFGAFMI
ncbi:hypothetical protein ACROYT_G039454 [Oculina patagonica]